MEITDTRHKQALTVEAAALATCNVKAYTATYWLALACCMLTSPVKAEREAGKVIVRKWKNVDRPQPRLGNRG